MTTADQHLSIDDILNQPAYGRGWVIGPVTHVDQARHECQVADRAGDTVTVCYRPEDEQAIRAAHRDSNGQSLKAFGLCEYQPGSVLNRLLQVERLCAVTREEAERLTFQALWDERLEMIDPSVWEGIPTDMAENHDEYLAREYHNDDASFDG